MEQTQIFWTQFFIVLSVCTVIFSIIGYAVYKLVLAIIKRGSKIGMREVFPFIIGIVLTALLFQNLATGIYQNATAEENRLYGIEMIVRLVSNSFMETLLMLGTYENYPNHIAIVNATMESVFGAGSAALLYSGYISFLVILAPILGYAVILDMLTRIFPKIKYRFYYFKKHFYFSELNERSLALAESIVNDHPNWFTRPLLVFTDVYINKEDEKSTELFIKARALGAICLSDDITRLTPHTCKDKYYFLMDEKELENIESLSELAGARNFMHLKKAMIYIFYQNDSYEFTERRIMDKLQERMEKALKKEVEPKVAKIKEEIAALRAPLAKQLDELEGELAKLPEKDEDLSEEEKKIKNTLTGKIKKVKSEIKKLDSRNPKDEVLDLYLPAIKRIRYYENLVFNLLEDIPLVTPVMKVPVSRDREREFNLTIFGNGNVGTQMLLSSTWCGQFYGYKLCINVVSADAVETAVGKINRINPDILESTRKECDMLKIFPDEENAAQEYSDPYFTFRYAQADLGSHDIDSIVAKNPFPENPNDVEAEHSILDSDYYFIALGSDELNVSVAEQLRRKILIHQRDNNVNKEVVIVMVVFNKYVRDLFNSENENCNVRIEPFGSLEESYSWSNVTMNRLNPYTRQLSAYYQTISISQARHETRERRSNNYNYWSTVARRIHTKYKVFTAYKYLHPGDKDDGKCGFEEKNYQEYNKMVRDGTRIALEQKNSGPDVFAYLTWLEHRRWNAYIRAIGYTLWKDGFGKKDHELKIHSCLVECMKEPVKKEHPESYTRKDMLDITGNFKRYDRPPLETEYLVENEAAIKMNISVGKLRRMCKKGTLPGAIFQKDKNKWLLPSDFVEKWVANNQSKGEN